MEKRYCPTTSSQVRSALKPLCFLLFLENLLLLSMVLNLENDQRNLRLPGPMLLNGRVLPMRNLKELWKLTMMTPLPITSKPLMIEFRTWRQAWVKFVLALDRLKENLMLLFRRKLN